MHDITVCYYYDLYLLLSRRIETAVRGTSITYLILLFAALRISRRVAWTIMARTMDLYCQLLQFASEIVHKYYSKNTSFIFLLVQNFRQNNYREKHVNCE